MKNFYLLSLSLKSPVDQASLVQLLTQEGCDCIQTSGGLCIKTSLSEDDLWVLLREHGLKDGFTVSNVDAKSAKEKALSKDIVAFVAAPDEVETG